MLKGKNVVIGVCGGIAAYKVVEVVSKLKKQGAEVDVIMTENAAKFVAPLTFQAISHRPVITDMFAEPKAWEIQHISLAEKADIMVIAPATANVIGKIANGIADGMLTTTIMATKSTVMIVPAMNTNMYENPVVQENLQKLSRLGYIIIDPGTGTMACGTSGKGRLPEPGEIVERITAELTTKSDYKGLKVLVTAGPTREAIDPVRYITNHSSGKMGYAIAGEAAKRGASVKLVSGPVNIPKPLSVDVEGVMTADEMYEAVIRCFKDFDVIIMAAAVADYKSADIAQNKIKKNNNNMSIELAKNPDIAAEIGKTKVSGKIHVGFCAETDDLIQNAKSKLQSKNFDMIVANDVTVEGAGFNVDTNIVKIIKKDGSVTELPLMSKTDVANRILDEILKLR